MLVAPIRQHLPLGLRSRHSRDLLDSCHAKRLELASCARGRVFVRESTADELLIHRVGRVGEDCYSRGDTAVNEVGRFEYPGAVSINRNDDDVRRLDGFVDDECPSSGPQNRFSDGGNTDANGSR
jgi:hypothetical protein